MSLDIKPKEVGFTTSFLIYPNINEMLNIIAEYYDFSKSRVICALIENEFKELASQKKIVGYKDIK